MAIRIPIISDFDSKGIERAVKEFQSLEGAGKKAGFVLSKAALPAAAAIAGLAAGLGMATKAAMEDAAAQDQLAGVLARSGLATREQVAAAEDYITMLSRQAAVADDELRPALATLVQSTGSVELAQDLLTSALDISASTGSDLATTVDALGKAYNGNTKGLKALDASLIPMIKDGASFDTVMQALAGTTGGAAANAANTAAGQMRGLKIQMDEAKESIGAALLPLVQKLTEFLLPLAQMAQENSRVFLIVAGVIGGVAAAILILNTGMKVYQATLLIVKIAQMAFNFVMTANPIGLVIVAIAALVAAFVFLEIKFGVVSKALSFMGDAFHNYIINPIQAALALISKLINALAKIPGVGALGNIVGGAIGKIPGLATGGIVTRPTLAMIGERGPEAVIPLSRGMAGGQGVTINISGVITEAQAGSAIVNALRRYNQLTGPINVTVA